MQSIYPKLFYPIDIKPRISHKMTGMIHQVAKYIKNSKSERRNFYGRQDI